ncbi:MAG: MCE family protein [Solirubrobacterales bacterium]|nr:MCE family protein [Solirubrobacterales bacterium]
MLRSTHLSRTLAIAAIVVGIAAVATVLLRSGATDYTVTARFQNASQLVKGNLVQVAGLEIGQVTDIDLTPDGEAAVKLKITDDDYAPLRRGTTAVVRQASLSGVANRYVDLHLPPGSGGPTIDDGGVLPADKTTSAVDLDQLFNTFDPRTRKALSRLFRGSADQWRGAGPEANAGFAYLDPSLAASSRLFRELNRDQPSLERFLKSSSGLVTDVAERRADLAGLIDHLATTTNAIAARRGDLGESIVRLPDFMRRANTTFVNLRATLDDLEPLVDESKPVAKKLRPFLAELRPLANDARPTLRDLAALTRQAGADNDLVELTRGAVPLRDIAVGRVDRNGKEREGALPASTKALAQSWPELATARPYAPDLTGWFDDFSHSGVYDALGGGSRAAAHVNGFTNVNGVLQPVPPELRQALFEKVASLGQRSRCPGAIERGATPKDLPEDFPCDRSEVPLGP